MEEITPEKSAPKKRALLSCMSSIPHQEPLLDEVVMKGLDNSFSLLYQALMSQPADTFGLDMDMPGNIFGVKSKIIMVVPDIINLFTND
jgi:hypothetical protein